VKHLDAVDRQLDAVPGVVARLSRELDARCREITARVSDLEAGIQLLITPLFTGAARRSRLWCAVNDDHRRNGWRPTLPFEGCPREAQRDGAASGLVGQIWWSSTVRRGGQRREN